MKNKTHLEIKFSPTRLKQIQKIALSGSRAKLKILNGKFEEGFDLLKQSAKRLKSFAIDLSKQLPLTLAGQVSLKLFSHFENQSSKKLHIPKGIVLGGILALMASLPAMGQTIDVINTNNSGAGSLRQAIIDANTDAANGIIHLQQGTIYPITSDLPAIVDAGSFGTLQIICTGTTNAIIDGGSTRRPITMNINSDLRLSKITIQNGSAPKGGGIYNNRGALTISSSTITNNEATGTALSDGGGGIFSSGNGGTASVLIQNSTISLNSATKNGAGIHNRNNSTLTISSSTISGNNGGRGGGIFNNRGALTISSSNIVNNQVTNDGGGIFSSGVGGSTSVLIQNSTINLNLASQSGGGIFNITNSTLTISNSTISGNEAAGVTSARGGGGIANTDGSSLTISSSTISNNQASGNVGGGVLNKDSNMTIQASSILYNQSNNAGSGVYIQGNANNTTSRIKNTTISNNASAGTAGGVFHKNLGSGTNIFNLEHVTISDNTSSSGTAGFDAATDNGTVNFNIVNTIIANSNTANDLTINGAGINNIVFQTSIIENTPENDPPNLFKVNPLLGPLTLNSGFLVHALQSGSPAINAGANIGFSYDQLGNPRNASNPFIGAVEVLESLVSCPITVINTNDAGAGSLRQAILDANANPSDCTINLTAGTTYTISSNLPIVTGTDVGGKLTIMTSGLPNAIIDGGGTRRPITMDINSDLRLSNITIQNGSAADGGGIFNKRGILTISSSNIINNIAADDGGGIYSTGNGGSASVLIQNSTISLNSANSLGGGVFNDSNSTLSIFSSTISDNTTAASGGGIYNKSPLIISNAIISGNTSNDTGGGIRHSASALTIHSASIINNLAGLPGGGIFISGANSVHIENTLISGNTSNSNGGGVFNFNNSLLTISSSTISGNTSNQRGGGIYNKQSSISILNSTISLNSATLRGGGIFNRQNSTLTISSSTISGNTTNADAAGVYNNSSNGLITNSYILENTSTLRGAGLVNSNNSILTIVSSTISGNIGATAGGLANVKSTLNINDSFVTTNQVTGGAGSGRGAGIYSSGNGGAAFLNIQNSTISLNSASTNGGGIFNFNSSTLTISSSTISGNTSNNYGGGIFNDNNSILTISCSSILGNTASAAAGIYNNSPLSLVNSSITANIASADAGAIWNVSSIATISNSLITGNSANRAGAIRNYGAANMTISSSTLSGNIATGIAGAIFNDGSTAILTISCSSLLGNTGTLGGGIYNKLSDLVIINNSYISSNASLRGGGIFSIGTGANPASVLIQNSTISLNSASVLGGGIYNQNNSPLTISSSTISENTSASNGGGIFNDRSNLTIQASTLAFNQSTSGQGGAMIIFGDPTTAKTVNIINTTISNNTAPIDAGIVHSNGAGVTNNIILQHLTLADNNGTGFINIGVSNITIQNSIIANSIGADFTLGTAIMNGASTNNIVADGSMTGAITSDPKLDVLQLFSGSLIHPFLMGSPAMNAGVNLGITVDQVGTLRIGLPDIGAFENVGIPCFVFTAVATAVAPVTIVWLGCVSSDWSDAANWSTNAVPSSSDVILLPTFSPILVISNNVSCRKIIAQKGSKYFVTKGFKIRFTSN